MNAARVLIIDDGHGLTTRLEAMLRATTMSSADHVAQCRTATGYLMALGELGVSDDPPDAIIGPVDALNGDLHATAAALHELAPQAKLIAVTQGSPAEQSPRIIGAGFDACISEEAAAAEVMRSITPSDESTNEHKATPVAAPTTDATTLAAPLDLPVIEQLLQPRGSVRDAALAFLEQHTAIPGLAFAESHPPDDHTAVPVARASISFGFLHAPPPACASALRPLADWLAACLLLHKQQLDLWFMAMRDELTGAWNRRYFQRFLKMALDRAIAERSTVTLLLFDVDDFKRYNDSYGHAAGDEILRETVRLMNAVVREHDIVARIGGDEFAVIFWDAEAPRRANSRHPADIAKVAERFRKAIAAHRFPKLTHEARGTLTISGGLASFPWDGQTPDELLAKADAMAFQSKQQGKNTITIGPTPA